MLERPCPVLGRPWAYEMNLKTDIVKYLLWAVFTSLAEGAVILEGLILCVCVCIFVPRCLFRVTHT